MDEERIQDSKSQKGFSIGVKRQRGKIYKLNKLKITKKQKVTKQTRNDVIINDTIFEKLQKKQKKKA